MDRWSLPGALAELEESWPDIELTAEWQQEAELDDAKAALKRFDGWLASRDRDLIGAEVRVDGTIKVPSGGSSTWKHRPARTRRRRRLLCGGSQNWDKQVS